MEDGRLLGEPARGRQAADRRRPQLPSYRARSYSGPFVYLEYAKVPVEIVRVPGKYHRHPLGGPPGKTGIHPNKGVSKTGYKASTSRQDWDPPKKGKSTGKKK